MKTVAMTTHTRIKSAIGYIIAKKVSLMLPAKCGSTGFAISAEHRVLRPKPKIENTELKVGVEKINN